MTEYMKDIYGGICGGYMAEHMWKIYSEIYEGFIWRSISGGYMVDYIKDIWKIYGGEYG